MNNIVSYYTKYKQHVDKYNKWEQEEIKQHKDISSVDFANNYEAIKQKAKAITEPILLFDNYEHEKAEDSETFFQTYNIELMSATTILTAIPVTITKLIPFLNKHSDKSVFIKKIGNLLIKYKEKTIKVGNKSIPFSKALTFISAIGSGIFYVRGMKKSMESQLGIIRKASFDASQKIIDNHKIFAVLNSEQEEELKSIVNSDKKNKSAIKNKIKDKLDINSSFSAVKEYKQNKQEYIKNKNSYFENLKQEYNSKKSDVPTNNQKDSQKLFESLMKNVEHNVLEQLRKVETVSNISYSALFTGGFLEYLISDKLVDVLNIQNKILKTIIKIGVPLITYFVLNKNISDIENKAILATKYKHLKQFSESPENFIMPNYKQESLPKFIKNIYNDIKEYEEFSQNELPLIKEKLEAKKQIKLTDKQENDAQALQKNTSMVLNNQRERVYEQTVGIKALSETILGPLDILATAVGGKIGNNLSKKCSNPKLSGILTGLGAVIAFIPAAIIEAKLTKQQKLAEKIAVMLSIKDMKDPNNFEDKTNEHLNFINTFKIPGRFSSVFKDFE